MIKKFIFIVLLLVIIFDFTGFSMDSVNDFIDNELENITIDNFNITEFKNDILDTGKMPDARQILQMVFDILLGETMNTLKTLAVLITPILLMGVISKLSLKSDGVLDMANMAAYLAISGIIVYIFSDAAKLSRETVDNINTMSSCMIPVLYSVMLTMGRVVGYSAMQPTVIFVTQVLILIIKNIVYPLIMLSFSLNITDNISGGEKFKKISELITKLTKWLLIFLISLFTAVLTAQNILTHSFDGVAIKGTKFAVANFIPVIGGAISEGTETIGASLILIKNATGISGIAAVVAIAFIPCIKIYLISFMFFVLSCISQIVSGEKVSKMLDSTGTTVSMLGATVVSSSFLFIISVAVMLT